VLIGACRVAFCDACEAARVIEKVLSLVPVALSADSALTAGRRGRRVRFPVDPLFAILTVVCPVLAGKRPPSITPHNNTRARVGVGRVCECA
jgi:hypothetical protein